ncbi:hypothetical protein BRADI_3g43990v3 [Brachypodium distachyon]|uniref:MYND-type domain-containing protein n=1 Tax=Brachypodium distachyon TaxID=15368 RepID=A0A2K2D331_BRADI|nr:hypothetical protein BRADI_3g43990v3 [Brachypodium distachyon]
MAAMWSGKSWTDEGAKRRRTTLACGGGAFDELHDELVVSILADVAATANSPADLAAATLTCKRFRELGQHKLVLARASPRCVAVRAKGWSDDAHRFLLRCSDAGNTDASYLLGMILYYCAGNRPAGSELLAQAALRGHAEALYSMAIIQFNGSGGSKDSRNLLVAAHLCAHAAGRGHTDALRELGHCVSDGYGVRKSVSAGRRLLVQANFNEMCAALRAGAGQGVQRPSHECLLSDFGCHHVAAGRARAANGANEFLAEWFATRPAAVAEAAAGAGLRLCSQPACGRPETRKNEFRRCSACGVVVYCSRACQALHWRAGHRTECANANAAGNANANVQAGAAAGGSNANAAASALMA